MPLPSGIGFRAANDNNSYVLRADDGSSYLLTRRENDLIVRALGQLSETSIIDFFLGNPNGFFERSGIRLDNAFFFPQLDEISYIAIPPNPQNDWKKFHPSVALLPNKGYAVAWIGRYQNKTDDPAVCSAHLVLAVPDRIPKYISFPVPVAEEEACLRGRPSICALPNDKVAFSYAGLTRVFGKTGRLYNTIGQLDTTIPSALLSCLSDGCLAIAATDRATIEIVTALEGSRVGTAILASPFSTILGLYAVEDGGFFAAYTNTSASITELRLTRFSGDTFNAVSDVLLASNVINPQISRSDPFALSWIDIRSGKSYGIGLSYKGDLGPTIELERACNAGVSALLDGNLLCLTSGPDDSATMQVMNGFTGVHLSLERPVTGFSPGLRSAAELQVAIGLDQAALAWISGNVTDHGFTTERQNLAVRQFTVPNRRSFVVPGDGVLEGNVGANQLFLNGTDTETVITRGGADVLVVPQVPNARATIVDFDSAQQKIDLSVFPGLGFADLIISVDEVGLACVELPGNQKLCFFGTPTLTTANFVFTVPDTGALFASSVATAGSVDDVSSTGATGLAEDPFSTGLSGGSSGTGFSGSGLFSNGSDSVVLAPTASATASGVSSGTGIFGSGVTGSTGPSQMSDSNNEAVSLLKSPAVLGGAAAALVLLLFFIRCWCTHRDSVRIKSTMNPN